MVTPYPESVMAGGGDFWGGTSELDMLVRHPSEMSSGHRGQSGVQEKTGLEKAACLEKEATEMDEIAQER